MRRTVLTAQRSSAELENLRLSRSASVADHALVCSLSRTEQTEVRETPVGLHSGEPSVTAEVIDSPPSRRRYRALQWCRSRAAGRVAGHGGQVRRGASDVGGLRDSALDEASVPQGLMGT